jgi:hypothetical protein
MTSLFDARQLPSESAIRMLILSNLQQLINTESS